MIAVCLQKYLLGPPIKCYMGTMKADILVCLPYLNKCIYIFYQDSLCCGTFMVFFYDVKKVFLY